jgi:hypothetical protein
MKAVTIGIRQFRNIIHRRHHLRRENDHKAVDRGINLTGIHSRFIAIRTGIADHVDRIDDGRGCRELRFECVCDRLRYCGK